MSAITPHYRNVQQLLQSQSFSIDEYQREYKWEKANVEELLSDLMTKFDNHFNAGDPTSAVSGYGEYFLGSIIVSKRNGKSYLVDGQQRVTSLTLLLIYLYRLAKAKELPVFQTVAPLIFSDNFGQPKFNLDIPERLPVIKALFEGQPFSPDGKEESVQTMYNRYQDIVESKLDEDLAEGMPHFIYWLMTRVGLIEISTDNDAYAYSIFETMNDRGKPLSPVDLLKSFLLAPIEDPEARVYVNKIWKREVLDLISWGKNYEPDRDSNFMKAWLRGQYAESIREGKAGTIDQDWERIGSEFHRWIRENVERLGLVSSEANQRFMSEHLSFFAKAYRRILHASNHFTPGLEAIYYNAHNGFTWQPTILLAPLEITDDEDTVDRKMAVVASYLDIWIMRRVVNYVRVAYSSVAYTMWRLCMDLRRKSLEDVVSVLEARLESEEATFEGFPSRSRYGLDDLGLNQFSRRYIFHLLARLTAMAEKGAGRNESFDQIVSRKVKNPYDIEHIVPDHYEDYASDFAEVSKFEYWRNHVASLLLLPADVNRSLKDKPFEEKRSHYARQNIYAASLDASAYDHQPQFKRFAAVHELPFAPFERFTKEEQLARRALVSAMVHKEWSPDRLREAAFG